MSPLTWARALAFGTLCFASQTAFAQAVGDPCLSDTECTMGNCVDGFCCDGACDDGCETCAAALGATANGTCSAAAAGTMCRAVAGGCDAPEVCDGTATTCPDDAVLPAFTICRQSTNDCDPADTCDGLSVDCPEDIFLADGAPCLDNGVWCDGEETCLNGVCGSYDFPCDLTVEICVETAASCIDCGDDDDGDGVGDLCEGDEDADGIPDGVDNCPEDENTDQEDSNDDGLGDECQDKLVFQGVTGFGAALCRADVGATGMYGFAWLALALARRRRKAA